jgi:hypothetical protein
VRSARLIVCATVIIAAATLVVRAQGRNSKSTRESDKAVRDLVAFTALVPPEFAADALIRLSSSSASKALQRELLEDAFMRAYGAQESHRRASTGSIPRDSRQGAEQLAFSTSLTRLSLQVRATQLMALVDSVRARELFDWIDLNPSPGRCEDPLVSAVDEYYTALSVLARTTFGRNRESAMRFLVLNLWRARLPVEMAAVARAVQRFQPTREEAVYLEEVVSAILEGGDADPRGFSDADLDIVSRVVELERAHHGLGVTDWGLMAGLRKYLLSQLKGPRCSDSVTESMTPAAFNMALKRFDADWVVPLLDPVIAPSRLLPAARIDFYWQTDDAWQLYDAELQLRGPGRNPYPERVRQTKEWRDRAERFLDDLARWSGRHEAAERDYFYQKAVLFEGLLDLAPRSDVRDRALRSFVEFLRESNPDIERRALWFSIMNRLLDAARGTERRQVLASLESSGSPILTLYVRLEQIAQ